VATLRQRHAAALAAVRGIGLSGQMHGAVLLDAADAVLRPAILWNDGRSAAQCATLEARVPGARVITGNLAMPGFTAPNCCGSPSTSPTSSIASAPCCCRRTTCACASRANGRPTCRTPPARCGSTWDSGPGRPPCLLPRDCPRRRCRAWSKGQRRRHTASALATAWGMRPEVVIAGGAGDNAAGAVGIGVIRSGQAFVSLGTSGYTSWGERHLCAQPGAHRTHLLSLPAGDLASDVGDPECGQLPRVDHRGHGGRQRGGAAGRDRGGGPRTGRRLSALPVGERTPHNDPTHAACSLGCGMTRRAPTSAAPCSTASPSPWRTDRTRCAPGTPRSTRCR